jgi:hypothetical protein
MDVHPPYPGTETPVTVYSTRSEHLQRAQASDRKQELRLGYFKFALLLAIILIAAVFFRHMAVLQALLLPAAAFILLAVLHERKLRSMRMRERIISFYDRGLARLQNRWAGSGETGERFLDPLHAYARDLDIFGPASLFQLLCTARTRAGEEILAQWLLSPAPVDEVHARQRAVLDLKNRLDFREQLSTLGETLRTAMNPDVLAAWGESAPGFADRFTRTVTRLLSVLWIASIVCWAIWHLGGFALAVSVLNLSWAHRIHSRLEKATSSLEKAADDLNLLASLLSCVEHERFSAPKLIEMQAALKRDGLQPALAIRRLARLVHYLESHRNQIARFFDLFTFWTAQVVFAAEGWQQQYGPQIRAWVSAVGEFEAITALSAYAYEHPQDVLPEFTASGPLFVAEGLAHPLLPVATAVCNDVKFDDGLQLILLSGPNMAGKSTFIRSIGINAVLAQCGAPVRATRLRLSPLAVAASICILDSLTGGVSRFYAEIQRIKLIVDLTRGPLPVLFLLDELLSGTNSHDRLEGTRFVVHTLTTTGAVGIVSTHDLALTTIPASMSGHAINFHFEDQVQDGRLAFDYKLKPGVVQTSNALELMRSIGLGIER